ncbi:hypothetical protein FF38_10724 [Lucilia cuprina]|uniref:Uncharacterized protein n=1 Tax=Lucilia cuprina TaxID=7375 RepID=A0A0L0BTE9_LUCCU|nr:hypothetical protein FF38_10724 [Lucilia cuprina]
MKCIVRSFVYWSVIDKDIKSVARSCVDFLEPAMNLQKPEITIGTTQRDHGSEFMWIMQDNSGVYVIDCN